MILGFPVIASRIPLYILDIDTSGFWATIKVVYSRPYKRGIMKDRIFSAMGYEKLHLTNIIPQEDGHPIFIFMEC